MPIRCTAANTSVCSSYEPTMPDDESKLETDRRTTETPECRSYQYDEQDHNSLSEAVVLAFEDVPGIDAFQTPLYNFIDPDALNELFTADHVSNDGHVSFQYDRWHVTVSNTGEISIDETVAQN